MINIKGDNNLKCELEGNIVETPTKIGYKEETTIHGEIRGEFIRCVLNLNLTIKYISSENYEKLKDIFFYENNRIELTDTKKGKIYGNMYISGESLSLEEHVDKLHNIYYYSGNIIINSR